ncbi:MAG: gluconokinase, GntK/IdnK-type [Sporichthyaceae bacterium]
MTATRTTPDTLVIVGATGDLTSRYLLPALAELLAAGLLPPGLRIRGVSRAQQSEAQFRDWVGAELAEYAPAIAPGVRAELIERCDYRAAEIATGSDATADSTLADASLADASLADALAGASMPVCYLALPAALFTPTARALARVGLPPGSRVAVEKPYGADGADAAALTEVLHDLVGAGSVFRVDHFLAEPAARVLRALRLDNRMISAWWNGEHVRTVEVVWDETLTLEGRASYYDRAGALRDVIANHLLALMALVAMEQPAGPDAADLHQARLELLRAVRTPGPQDIAATTRRARYTAGMIGERAVPHYTDEPGVDPDRATETLAEVALRVDNARWAGTVFALRTGKALGRTRTEITLRLGPVNVLRLRMHPPHLSLQISADHAGTARAGTPVVLGTDLPPAGRSPYAQVLHAILTGDQALSVQAAEVRESWRIMGPILASWADGVPPLQSYPAGSRALPARTVVVCGVSGVGKSKIGAPVAADLGWTFADADDFHNAANRAKMASGTPLSESDRAGWLAALAEWIGAAEQAGRSSVLACSALRRAHRDVLRRGHPSVRFVHLRVPEPILRRRLADRRNHFMPASQLDDQLATWEPLDAEEPGFVLDAAAPVDDVVERLLQILESLPAVSLLE